MSVVIRRAAPTDAGAIAAIALEAFGERLEAESDRVARVLRQNTNFVAQSDDRVAGFVGNFVTRSGSGALRFELDLLAVAEDTRGIGIGGALVAASLDAAEKAKVDVIRALVASRNRTMQGLCQMQGFKRNLTSHALYVLTTLPPHSDCKSDIRDGAGLSSAIRHEAHLIPVETLTYSGIWLEGNLSQVAIHDARKRANVSGMTRIGTVLPQAAKSPRELLAANGFDRVGEFDWWTVTLRSG